MYYRDLSSYRIGRESRGYTVFPTVKNIGWLSPEMPFQTGNVPERFLYNLREVLFVDRANAEGKRNSEFPEIVIKEKIVRAPPRNCPICNKKVIITPNVGGYYTGTRKNHLGKSSFRLFSFADGVFHAFPSLVYHYVSEHNYKPPQVFIESILNFDFNVPYDESEYYSYITQEKISATEM